MWSGSLKTRAEPTSVSVTGECSTPSAARRSCQASRSRRWTTANPTWSSPARRSSKGSPGKSRCWLSPIIRPEVSWRSTTMVRWGNSARRRRRRPSTLAYHVALASTSETDRSRWPIPKNPASSMRSPTSPNPRPRRARGRPYKPRTIPGFPPLWGDPGGSGRGRSRQELLIVAYYGKRTVDLVATRDIVAGAGERRGVQMTTADTDTAAGALGAMLAHHVALAEGVRRRVDAVCTTVERGDHHGMATAELVAYLAKEVLPHATVEGLVDEHRTLLSLARRLATAGDGVSAAAAARAIGTLFAAHVGKEDELILLPLAADQAVDLAGLADQMHRLIEAAQGVLPEPGEATAPDTEATLLQLLLDGARLLANGEQGDAACRLAAEAWATVRAPRPDLAVRATAALHGLVGPLRGEGAGLRTGTRLSATA